MQRHQVAGAHAKRAQLARDAARPQIEFAIAQGDVSKDDGGRVGRSCRLLLEQLVNA